MAGLGCSLVLQHEGEDASEAMRAHARVGTQEAQIVPPCALHQCARAQDLAHLHPDSANRLARRSPPVICIGPVDEVLRTTYNAPLTLSVRPTSCARSQ